MVVEEPRRKRTKKVREEEVELEKEEDKKKERKDNKEETTNNNNKKMDEEEEKLAKKRKPETNPIMTRAGGAYIPPAKLKMIQEQIADKGSEEYQRIYWERLKKKILGLVNRANVGILASIVRDLMKENIVRGKGLLARSVMQAQTFSPTYSHVYAALVAVINSKFPHIGELILRRLAIQFKRSFRRNDKQTAVTASKFLAHFVNQQVVHEVLALEILTLLLENPTDDSVEVAIAFLKECGQKLSDVTPAGLNACFDRLRAILHDQNSGIDKRVQYMIEVLFHIRKDKFSAHPALMVDLDLIEDEDQITHMLSLEEAQDPENMLNIFKFDPEFEKNEEIYNEIKMEILGESDDEEDESGEESGEEEIGATTADGSKTAIIDDTGTQLVAFRRTVYLTIQSSLNFQEAAHKLLKMEMPENFESELCHMLVDCCCQQRTYEKFFGLLCERFCLLRKEFKDNFQKIFQDSYETVHRFEITKLRNLMRLFGHLLYTDAISWEVLAIIKLNEDDTTSASRIAIKILFQELSEFLGMESLYERVRDPTLQVAFDGIFPRDNPRDTRFAINFFTSIGLGGLTVDLREHLKSGPKQIVNLPHAPDETQVKKEQSSSSSSSSSSSDSSDTESEPQKESRKPVRKSVNERKRPRPPVKERSPKEKYDHRSRPIRNKSPESRTAGRERSPKEKYSRRSGQIQNKSPDSDSRRRSPVRERSPKEKFSRRSGQIQNKSPDSDSRRRSPVRERSPKEKYSRSRPIGNTSPDSDVRRRSPVRERSPKEKYSRNRPIGNTSPDSDVRRRSPVRERSPKEKYSRSRPIGNTSPDSDVRRRSPVRERSPKEKYSRNRPIGNTSPDSDVRRRSPVRERSPKEKYSRSRPIGNASPDSDDRRRSPVRERSPKEKYSRRSGPIRNKSPDSDSRRRSPAERSPKEKYGRSRPIRNKSPDRGRQVERSPKEKYADRRRPVQNRSPDSDGWR